MGNRFAALLLQILAAVVVVYAIYWLPTLLLLRAIPWLPSSVDAWFVIFAVQVLLFVGIACAFRAPLLSVSRVGLPAAGARAVFWLLSGGALFAMLGAMTIVSTSDAAGFRVANGLQSLTRYFPISGIVGGLLRNLIVVPVFEEFVFRVFVLGWLLRATPSWFALLLSTALFASLHDAPLIAALIGLALGLLYLRYGSVWLCILAHAGSNALTALGVPMLVAHLHEIGVIGPIRGNLLLIQLTWFLVVLACFWMFVRCLRDKGGGTSRSNDPVRDPCAASSSPPATPASSASSGTCSRPSDGTSSRNPT